MAKRRISGKQITGDIRSGMTISQLLKKYNLSPRELQSLFKQVELVLSDAGELYGRAAQAASEVDPRDFRFLPRNDVPLPVPIYDIAYPQAKGILFDITEKGLGVEGLETEVSRIHSLTVDANTFFPISSFTVQAACRWVNPSGTEIGYVAGFEVTGCPKECISELLKLIQSLNLINRATSDASLEARPEGPQISASTGSELYRCLFCGFRHTTEFDECPRCGIVVKKYLQKLDEFADRIRKNIHQTAADREWRRQATGESPDMAGRLGDTTERSLTIFNNVWKDLELLGGDTNHHVNKALLQYVDRVKARQWFG